MTRLLQDETQTHDSKGLSRWLSAEEHAVLRAAVADSAEIVHPGRACG